MKCQYCGAEIDSEAKICSYCGQVVNDQNIKNLNVGNSNDVIENDSVKSSSTKNTGKDGKDNRVPWIFQMWFISIVFWGSLFLGGWGLIISVVLLIIRIFIYPKNRKSAILLGGIQIALFLVLAEAGSNTNEQINTNKQVNTNPKYIPAKEETVEEENNYLQDDPQDMEDDSLRCLSASELKDFMRDKSNIGTQVTFKATIFGSNSAEYKLRLSNGDAVYGWGIDDDLIVFDGDSVTYTGVYEGLDGINGWPCFTTISIEIN